MRRKSVLKTKEEIRTFYCQKHLTQHEKGHVLMSPLKVQRVLLITDIKKEDFILDIGCARGEILLNLCERFENTGIGIDISMNVLKQARKLNGIKYLCGDAEMLPFAPQTFTKILCLDVLEHCPNPTKVVREISRLLRKNGEAIIQVPTSGFVSSLLTKDFHEGHLRYYTRKKIVKALTSEGFRILGITLYNSIPLGKFFIRCRGFKFLLYLMNLIPPKLYTWFGSIVLRAKKM